jgi:hypothetical protein
MNHTERAEQFIAEHGWPSRDRAVEYLARLLAEESAEAGRVLVGAVLDERGAIVANLRAEADKLNADLATPGHSDTLRTCLRKRHEELRRLANVYKRGLHDGK